MPALLGLSTDSTHVDPAPALASTEMQNPGIRVGVTLSPTGSWPDVVVAATLADELGLDAVGFWDHYHSMQPEWAMICGWSAYGYLAAVTQNVHLVPMVICRLNYTLGVLAKESSVLAIASGGRFEFAIGAGDYPPEYEAWHQTFPDSPTRIAALGEYVTALRALWTGRQATQTGDYVNLTNAACTPVPPVPPRVVVGVGNSKRLIDAAVAYADELNVYENEATVTYAWDRIASTGRPISLSIFGDRNPATWPNDLPANLEKWQSRGASRYFLSIGWDDDLPARVRDLAAAQAAVTNGS